MKEYIKEICAKCDKPFGRNVISRHVIQCLGLMVCPVCQKQFTGSPSKKTVTCSYSCSNTLFRSGENNPNWKPGSYRTTCFLYHDKKCVICDEDKIVAVHHMNENKKDNRPENLVPLCPTHHQYFHSKYRWMVESMILDYLEEKFRTVAQG